MLFTANSLRFSSGIASLLAVTLLCGQASAIPAGTAYFQKAQAKAAKQAQAQAAGNQLKEAVHMLSSVHYTLKHADHDYGGNRAAAMHAIGAAEHQLKLIYEHHHKHGTTVNKPKVKGPAVVGEPEPQQLSDAQLAKAIPTLNSIAAFISQANHDFGGHRANAIKDIQVAVVDLQKALKYSAVKNAGKP